MSVVTYGLKQGGVIVASVTALPDQAMREIQHYAMIYGQDGPCEVVRKIGRKWERVA